MGPNYDMENVVVPDLKHQIELSTGEISESSCELKCVRAASKI